MFETYHIVWEQCLNYIGERMEYIKKGHRFGEDSITDELIYKIETANPPDSEIYHAPNESNTGADIEWWLMDTDRNKGIVLRIQGKKLTGNGAYGGINDNVGGSNSKQIDRLISRAIKDRIIPLYGFYNYRNGIRANRSLGPSKEECWTYARAHTVRALIPKGSTPSAEISPSGIKPMGNIVDLISPSPLFPFPILLQDLVIPFVHDMDPSNRRRFERYSRFFHQRVLSVGEFMREEHELNRVVAAYKDRLPNPHIEAKYLLITYLTPTSSFNTNISNILDSVGDMREEQL